MIRAVTIISALLAGGTVLYTYQAKHEVDLLDRQIKKMLIETTTLREQSRALKTEWTLRESPERLREFTDKHLSLKPLLPAQFTTFAELSSRLPVPSVVVPPPNPAQTTEEPKTQAELTLAELTLAEEDLPIPPLPVPPPLVLAAVAPVSLSVPPSVPVTAAAPERKAPPPKPVAVPASPLPIPAASQPTRVTAPPIQMARVVPPAQPFPVARPALSVPASPIMASPIMASSIMAAPPSPMAGGSLLGMAHGGPLPAPMPRPVPMNNQSWSNGN